MAEETPTFRVELPPTIHVVPDEERAVAIDVTPVTPVEQIETRTIELRPAQALAAAQAYAERAALEAAPATRYPPLPVEPRPVSRHGRRYRPSRAETAHRQPVPVKPGARPLPEGAWPELVYGLTLTAVNLGDSRAIRHRKATDARIARPLGDAAHLVPVVSRKGGVGATTVTTLLGLALADGRDDRVLAVDAHPERPELGERVASDDLTGLEIAALGADGIADEVAGSRGVVLADGPTGLADPTVQAALARADGLVVVSGGTAEQARAASEAITWLEEHDYADLAGNTVVALDTATPGTRYESLDAIERHFRGRVRDVVRIPYDEELVAGAPVRYGALRPDTREAARELAALVVDGLLESSAA